jgi:low affinity Fe/Cu permease
MGSLTIAFVLANIALNTPFFSNLFLGIIATALFHFLCKYGQERVNWIFLGMVLIYILMSIVFKNAKKNSDDAIEIKGKTDNACVNEDECVCSDTIEPKKKRKEKKKNRC